MGMNLLLQGLVAFLATYGLLVLVAGLSQSLRAWRRGSRPPFVSVVLLARDLEAGIEGLILDVLSMDYLSDRGAPNFELIVVDDRSTDSTPAILERLAQRHAALRVARLAEAGRPGQPAVEVGLFLATSPAVLVFDVHSAAQLPQVVEALDYLLGKHGQNHVQPRPASL
ncbi:MAG: glycosyltransferase [Firmicutes bacterium]|nr:glycosyltransferase [Bacillota bacterium]